MLYTIRCKFTCISSDFDVGHAVCLVVEQPLRVWNFALSYIDPKLKSRITMVKILKTTIY